jgi:hypothetical protein
MTKGSCNCGAVSFEIAGEVSQVIVCHCSICRKSTGSNGIPVVLFAKNDFRWLTGADNITEWKKPDADWKKAFCKTCGSPLPGENDEERMFAPAGVITESGDLHQVIHHIWVKSKAAWDEIGDAGVQHPSEFGSTSSKVGL